MTREEELDWLCRLRSEIYVYMPKEWLIPMSNALDMAISALEKNEVCNIPKGMTNGEVIQALFPNVSKYNNALLENHSRNILFDDEWWDAPYKKGE